MAEPGMQDHRRRLFAAFPQARALDEALATTANRTPLFFMMPAEDGDLQGAWWALGRLGPTTERQFNINGEVLFVFAPWRDFQRRAYNAITQRLFEEVRVVQERLRGERFTPDRKIVMVATPDPKAGGNISAWNKGDSPSRAVFVPPLPEGADQATELAGALATTLSRRDLYSGKNPVTGDDFFGRRGLLEELSAQLENDQNIAILGFRRSGKTSVLLELKRRLLRKGTLVSITDLEPVKDPARLPGIIAGDVLNALRAAKAAGQQVWIGAEAEQKSQIDDYGQLSARLRRVAERNSHLRFVLAVDEIESLSPLIRSAPHEVRALLGALRAAAQSSPNVSTAFTGVANRIFVRGTLGDGYDNPVFGFVEAAYLRSFEAAESAELLRALGEPMLLDWTDEAVREAHELTGGLPYFVRSIGSAVRSVVDESVEGTRDLTPIAVSIEMVRNASLRWKPAAVAEWRGIVESLSMHYPGASELLASETDSEVAEWIRGDGELQETAATLAALGLLTYADESYGLSETLGSIRSISMPTRRPRPGVASEDYRERIAGVIQGGENQLAEFKQTARVNTHTGEKDVRMEDEVVKTVAAFLNADGGDLLIGVADDGSIHGLGDDIRVTKNRDYFLQWVTGSLLSERLGKSVVTQHVRLRPVELEGREVLVVHATPSKDAVWAKVEKDSRLYVRNGNHTVQLEGSEVTHFIRNRMRT